MISASLGVYKLGFHEQRWPLTTKAQWENGGVMIFDSPIMLKWAYPCVVNRVSLDFRSLNGKISGDFLRF
jgi:hypothetical protein